MTQASRTESSGISRAVRQVGDGWSLLIVWEALNGTSRFDNFHSRLGVARNILSNRLARLVEDGILIKRPVRLGARRREYRVTPKGEALRPALERLESWGQVAMPSGAEAGEPLVNGKQHPQRGYVEIRH